jgi:hypothetical protein
MALRTDLQNKAKAIGDTMVPKVGPTNQYGEVAKLMRGLQQVPSGPASSDVRTNQQQPQAPRQPIDLLAMTNNPNEPITAGAAYGLGMGPLQAGIPISNPLNDAVIELRNIARMNPDSGLGDLIDKYEIS